MVVYADESDRDAPIARDDSVRTLVNVQADVSHIPEESLHRRQGSDGNVSESMSRARKAGSCERY